METTGRVKEIKRGPSGKYIVELELDNVSIEALNRTAEIDPIDIRLSKHTKKRSLNANALLWECLGEIAALQRADKWEIYLMMLRRYGQYTYVCIHPGAVDMLRRQWRECEQIGELTINGKKAVQMLCYYGSSTYDSKEFSVLLDGVISEMRELGLPTPMPEEVRQSLETWEKQRTVGGG